MLELVMLELAEQRLVPAEGQVLPQQVSLLLRASREPLACSMVRQLWLSRLPVVPATVCQASRVPDGPL